jgi:3-deoxy-D-manno-octulosonic-acid transferase
MYRLYSFLTAAGAILLLPYFLVRGRGKYLSNLRERMGHLPAGWRRPGTASQGAIWIHAVSVGEAIAAVPLARRLKKRFPARPVVVSTTTLTGQRIARERMGFADGFFFFPLDWPGPVRRVLRAVAPALVIILETEIWPNFLREARRASVPVVFVNGRISDRSFARYLRANGLFGGFLGRVLADAELFLMQSEADAERVRALGAPAGRVAVAGNMKYDLAAPEPGPFARWLEGQLEEQERWPVVIAGSVVADEEEPVLAAFDLVQRRWRRALLVLAPRKPERFEAAARIVAERGWQLARRSALKMDAPLDAAADVLLLDTVGELAALYRLADAVFVGGSLVPAGGHNILEPACFGKAPVFGPSMENFRDIAARFVEIGAGRMVGSAAELGQAWLELVEDEMQRLGMGLAAQALIERHSGATDRVLERLAAVLEPPGSGT